jgi:hypothetical protein
MYNTRELGEVAERVEKTSDLHAMWSLPIGNVDIGFANC